MRRLRQMTRVDDLKNQQRSDPVRWGKRIYLCIIAVLVVIFADYLVGDIVMLRASGMVVNDSSVVGAAYEGRIKEIYVKEGDRVLVGDLLIEMESPEMLRTLAQLAIGNADLAAKEAQLKSRISVVDSLLPLASRHAKQSSLAVEQIDGMTKSGFISSERMDRALDSEYETAARLADLESQSKLLEKEFPMVSEAYSRALGAMEKLEASYANGIVRALRGGTVGFSVPSPGQVVKLGDELLRIYGDKSHVLAYLPDSYFFSVSPGDSVEITKGTISAVGKVDAILTLAEALPPEFQNMFRPRDRNRLLRISLPPEHGFAVSQKVEIRDCPFNFCLRSWSKG